MSSNPMDDKPGTSRGGGGERDRNGGERDEEMIKEMYEFMNNDEDDDQTPDEVKQLKLLCRDPDERKSLKSNSVVVRKVPKDATKEQISSLYRKGKGIKTIYFPKVALNLTTKYCFITFDDNGQAKRAQKFFDGYKWDENQLEAARYDSCFKYRQQLTGKKGKGPIFKRVTFTGVISVHDVTDDDDENSYRIDFEPDPDDESQEEAARIPFMRAATGPLQLGQVFTMVGTNGECAECGEPLTERSKLAYGKLYHHKCLKCASCQNEMDECYENGGLFCRKCATTMFESPCYGCFKRLYECKSPVEALGLFYHAKCFHCATCKQGLVGEFWYDAKEESYCREHRPEGTSKELKKGYATPMMPQAAQNVGGEDAGVDGGR